VIRVVIQLAAVVVVGLVVAWLWNNLTTNLRARGLPMGFEFLDGPAGVNIADSEFRPSQPVRDALFVGIKNTLALVVAGIPLLTVIGIVVGVSRLSTNWLVAKSAAAFVEVLRNLPPLLIIFFVFNAVILELPGLSESFSPFGLLVINNRRISVLGFTASAGVGWFWALVLVGVVIAFVVWRWRTKRFDETGEPHHRVLWAGGALLLAAVVAYMLTRRPVQISLPVLDGRRIDGGFSGLGAYFGVLAALVLYTSSHVAEIVRGSIQAVSKGQVEAADALSLSPFQRLRFVVLPQAFRIAIPPIINQYLNYTKNTSLAIAIGYAEITRIVNQAIGNANPAPQMILILMLVYLAFSLTISAVSNVVNRRLQIVGRT
jgi:general L-amino acid transport system permease protein